MFTQVRKWATQSNRTNLNLSRKGQTIKVSDAYKGAPDLPFPAPEWRRFGRRQAGFCNGTCTYPCRRGCRGRSGVNVMKEIFSLSLTRLQKQSFFGSWLISKIHHFFNQLIENLSSPDPKVIWKNPLINKLSLLFSPPTEYFLWVATMASW